MKRLLVMLAALSLAAPVCLPVCAQDSAPAAGNSADADASTSKKKKHHRRLGHRFHHKKKDDQNKSDK